MLLPLFLSLSYHNVKYSIVAITNLIATLFTYKAFFVIEHLPVYYYKFDITMNHLTGAISLFNSRFAYSDHSSIGIIHMA